MKRSLSFSTSFTVGAMTLLAAAPAFAQDYTYDYGSEGDLGALMASMGFLAFCCLVPTILLAIFNVWMLVDAILRQEHEYPNSTGNSKLLWILLLVFVGLIASIAYYFMVFKKIKRGRGGQPPMAGPAGYQAPVPPPAAPPAAPPPPPAPPVPPAPPAPEGTAPDSPVPPTE